jgi:hypothetical protein
MPRGWTPAIIDKQQQVLIHGLPRVTGAANYALVCALLATYEADRQAGRAPESYRYTSAAHLANGLSVDEATLRRDLRDSDIAISSLFWIGRRRDGEPDG